MTHHNTAVTDCITCRKCGERAKSARPKSWDICEPCLRKYNAERQRDCRAKNGDKMRAHAREQYRKNPTEKIVRARVLSALKEGGYAKWGRVGEITGRTAREIADQALAMGYRQGMHLDHIVSFAELRKRYNGNEKRVQREAWAAHNLRVIPADENMRKGARREFLC